MAQMTANPPVHVTMGPAHKPTKKVVEGEYVEKHFAVHVAPVGTGWAVTHRPSGLRAIAAPNKSAAMAWATTVVPFLDFEEIPQVLAAARAIDVLELNTELQSKTTAKAWQSALAKWKRKHGGDPGRHRKVEEALEALGEKGQKPPKKPKKKGKGKGKKKRSKKKRSAKRRAANVLLNPIKGMPGGSVTGCMKLMRKTRQDIDDPGAYCAAIADRIEPGWRERNPDRGIFRYRDHTIEVWQADDRGYATIFGGPGAGEFVADIEAVNAPVVLQLAKAIVDGRVTREQRTANIGEPHWTRHRRVSALRTLWAGVDEEINDFLRKPKKSRKWRELTDELQSLVYQFEGANEYDYQDVLEHARNRVFRAWGEMDVDDLLESMYAANPSQLGLFGEQQAEVEGFALVSPPGEPTAPVRPPRGVQERLVPEEKPSREAMEQIRERELAQRTRRRRTTNTALRRRLTR